MDEGKMGKHASVGRLGAAVQALLPVLGLIFFVAPARADLRFTQPTADAGQVRAGAPLKHAFAFVNEGPQAVDIVSLRASCGCLKPHVDHRTWESGEKGDVDLEVHTLGLGAGMHTWRLHVNYQIGEASYEAALQLTGNVITEVSVTPAAVTVFAEAAVGHDILLTDLRETPLTISGLQASSPKIKTELVGSYTDELGRQVRKIHIEVANDCPEGRHEEVVDIYTNDPSYRDLRVPVTIVKRSPQKLTLYPAQVDLVAAPGQAVPSRIVLVRPAGEQAVAIDRVECDNPAVVVQWARGPGTAATLRINVDRSKLTVPQLQTTVRVHVHQPVDQLLTIPVNCVLQ
jgi:hypothetical protein